LGQEQPRVMPMSTACWLRRLWLLAVCLEKKSYRLA